MVDDSFSDFSTSPQNPDRGGAPWRPDRGAGGGPSEGPRTVIHTSDPAEMSAVQMQPTKTLPKADKRVAALRKENETLKVQMELMLKLHQMGALQVQLPEVQQLVAPAVEAPKKKRAKKDPDAPKKAPTEYNKFVAAKTAELKDTVFDADDAQKNSRLRMAEIGKLWKAFTAARQQMDQPVAECVWEEERGVEPVVVVA